MYLYLGLHCEQFSSELQARLEVFINTLVSNFAFLNPEEGEEAILPQKIDNHWQKVTYQFKKIDISPKKGWRAELLEEDRIYAYGLETTLLGAYPYLLLMGTTYLTGQGAYLSLLSNLSPGLSIGESHDLSELDTWMRQQTKVKITGHSQGGTMAMLVTANYFELTHAAYCLNPAILHKETLLRLKQQLAGDKINVYIQERDPIFVFGDLLLDGTRIFHVTHSYAKKYTRMAAHALHFSGHPEATIIKVDDPKIDSNARKFSNDFKYFADRTLSPLLNISFIYAILLRKFKRFYRQYEKMLRALLFASSIITSIALIATGILSPAAISFAAPFLSYFHPIAAYSALLLGSIIASGIATYLIPHLIQVASKIVSVVTTIGAFFLAGAALLIGAVCAGVLQFVRGMNGEPVISKVNSRNNSTKITLSALHNTKTVANNTNIIYQVSPATLAENFNKVSSCAVAIQIDNSKSHEEASHGCNLKP